MRVVWRILQAWFMVLCVAQLFRGDSDKAWLNGLSVLVIDMWVEHRRPWL